MLCSDCVGDRGGWTGEGGNCGSESCFSSSSSFSEALKSVDSSSIFLGGSSEGVSLSGFDFGVFFFLPEEDSKYFFKKT